MPKDPITFRPPDWLAEKLSQRKGNRSEIINKALDRYLSGVPIEDELLQQMKELQITLAEIKKLLEEK